MAESYKTAVADGTAASPGYQFEADADTGRRRSAADTMRDVAGGTDVVEYTATTVKPLVDLDASAGLKVGSGAEVTKTLKGTGTPPSSVGATTAGSFNITVTGAAVGDPVFIGWDVDAQLVFSGSVSAADTVTVSYYNPTGGSIATATTAVALVLQVA